MLYREYGKTGKKVSLLGFGGMRFGDIDNHDQCMETMLEAARGGINYFDTAPGYFGTRSEEVYGQAFNEFKRQGLPFFSATKTFKSTEADIRTEIEAQLKRLNLEAIDFYHIWCITSLANWQERKKNNILDTFRKLKEEGLIRHICVSSHLVDNEIRDLLNEGVFEGVLFGYSAYSFAFRQAAFEAITGQNLGCVVMNPLGGGLIPENPEIFDFVRTREDETVVEGALRFLFAHKAISSVLVGFSNPDQVREAFKAIDGYQEIPKDKIEAMKSRVVESFKDLCTGCQYCENCPEGIPVSRLMDAYNYLKLYGKNESLLDRLKWHWNIPPAEAEKCIGCGQCEDACTQHLAIMDRLAEIAEIGRNAPKE
jgi:uncharacterized protein